MINPAASELGRRNAIIWGRARDYHVREFPGPLSIKSVVSGSAVWETREGRFDVDPDSYIVLNHGQPYSITVESPQIVETFCVFFQRGFVEDAYRTLSTPANRQLDAPFSEPASAGFFERLQPHDAAIVPRLRSMHRRVAAGTASEEWLEDQFLKLAEWLVRLKAEVGREMARLPAVRASTRAELFRRLHRGKRYLDASLDQPLTLPEIARNACLSPFHFHRLFSATFGETPHVYVVRRRLEKAARLLSSTAMPVTEISLESGFQSLGSFSTLFRRRFGRSPREYRQDSAKR